MPLRPRPTGQQVPLQEQHLLPLLSAKDNDEVEFQKNLAGDMLGLIRGRKLP